jgi:hypothetical protein
LVYIGGLFYDIQETAAQKQEQAQALQKNLEFLKENIGKKVVFYLGNSPHHVTILALDEDYARFRYSEPGMKFPSWMDIKYIDKFSG